MLTTRRTASDFLRLPITIAPPRRIW